MSTSTIYEGVDAVHFFWDHCTALFKCLNRLPNQTSQRPSGSVEITVHCNLLCEHVLLGFPEGVLGALLSHPTVHKSLRRTDQAMDIVSHSTTNRSQRPVTQRLLMTYARNIGPHSISLKRPLLWVSCGAEQRRFPSTPTRLLIFSSLRIQPPFYFFPWRFTRPATASRSRAASTRRRSTHTVHQNSEISGILASYRAMEAEEVLRRLACSLVIEPESIELTGGRTWGSLAARRECSDRSGRLPFVFLVF